MKGILFALTVTLKVYGIWVASRERIGRRHSIIHCLDTYQKLIGVNRLDPEIWMVITTPSADIEIEDNHSKMAGPVILPLAPVV